MGEKGTTERRYRGEVKHSRFREREELTTHSQIYMFRLLLEYGRIIDDNRDRIGYSGDGSELDKYDGVSPLDKGDQH